MGHGTGKLFRIDENGHYNFDKPNTKSQVDCEPVKSWYLPGETYASKFGVIASSYEECRAISVALYLILDRRILQIFGIKDPTEQYKIIQVAWLSKIYLGLKALQMYNPTSRQWLQAHSRGCFVILNVLMRAGENFVKVTETENGTNLLLTMDDSQIQTVGQKAMKKFLIRMQIYKSTADIEAASKMYERYSAVSNSGRFPFLKWREIVVKYKSPRIIHIQHNTAVKDEQVDILSYEPTVEGLVKSWIDRYPNTELDDLLLDMVEENKKYFPLAFSK